MERPDAMRLELRAVRSAVEVLDARYEAQALQLARLQGRVLLIEEKVIALDAAVTALRARIERSLP